MPEKTMRLAWGITATSDKLDDSVHLMEDFKNHGYKIDVFVSKEGENVLKQYNKFNTVSSDFRSCTVDVGIYNNPLDSDLQSGIYDALIIAPASPNVVAKIANGIADTLITHAVVTATKSDIPVFVFPSDTERGSVKTKTPDGRVIDVRTRRIDRKNVKRISWMQDVIVFKSAKSLKSKFSLEE